MHLCKIANTYRAYIHTSVSSVGGRDAIFFALQLHDQSKYYYIEKRVAVECAKCCTIYGLLLNNLL